MARTDPAGRARTPAGPPVGGAPARRYPGSAPPPGTRAQLRQQLRQELHDVQRLRALTLGAVVVVLLAAVPLFFAIRSATRDPVFADLDALDLPRWAATQHRDDATGSRWCLRECRFRERTWQSERSPEETAAVYDRALRRSGWMPWSAPGCPVEGIDGYDSCWQRDEYVLDLWARQPVCEPTRPTVGPTDATPSPPAVPAGPSASGSASAPPPRPACPGAVVTAKVFNRTDFHAPQG